MGKRLKFSEVSREELQIKEDEFLDRLASERDTENARFISHKEFWEMVESIEEPHAD
ncbi:MAG: hypothetical protein AAB373_01925 [Patescibacteria group bacterium]